jgi:2-phospho-L-lactate guanylyltransferase
MPNLVAAARLSTAIASTALLVPVKDLTRAKTRLAPLLSEAERRHLAELLLEGTLRAACAVPGDYRRVVVTSYPPAAALAQALGMEVIHEGEQRSESHSVDSANAALEREGVTGLLRIPLDLPLVQSADLAAILAEAARGARAVLVPSLSGTGTNALYRSPPTLFPSHFGLGSLALHEAEARRATDALAILQLESLALDIDDAADVQELVRRGTPCAALDFLRSIRIEQRLEALLKEQA